MTSVNIGDICLHLYIIKLEYENAEYNSQVNDKCHLKLNEKFPNFLLFLYWKQLDLSSKIILFSIYAQMKGTEQHLADIHIFFSFNVFLKKTIVLFFLLPPKKLLHVDVLIVVIYNTFVELIIEKEFVLMTWYL